MSLPPIPGCWNAACPLRGYSARLIAENTALEARLSYYMRLVDEFEARVGTMRKRLDVLPSGHAPPPKI